MTPKEKAEELIAKFEDVDLLDPLDFNFVSRSFSTKCANIVVDEIIKTDMLIDEEVYVNKPSYLQYWLEVKMHLKD